MFVQLGGWLPAAPGGRQSRVELDAWREASEDTFPCLFRKLLTQSSRHANCVGNRKAASRPARASDLSVCVRARFRRASASSDSRSARVKRPGLTAPKPPGSPLARVTRVCWARSEPQALGLENSPRPRPRPRTAPPCLLAPPCGPRPPPAWPAVFSVSGGGGGGRVVRVSSLWRPRSRGRRSPSCWPHGTSERLVCGLASLRPSDEVGPLGRSSGFWPPRPLIASL